MVFARYILVSKLLTTIFFQDSLDFFLGNFTWEDHKVSPFRDSAQLKVRIIPILALVSLSMAIIGVLLPPSKISVQLKVLTLEL